MMNNERAQAAFPRMLWRYLFLAAVISMTGRSYAYTLPGPINGIYARFPQGRKEPRILLIFDPAKMATPSVTSFETPYGTLESPVPLSRSGVYNYPSFTLEYPLDDWSLGDGFSCDIANSELRFILREVGVPAPPVNADRLTDLWGFALYDRGKLVRYYPPETIWRRYGHSDYFRWGTPPLVPQPYETDWDVPSGLLQITTQWRGPAAFDKKIRWYREVYEIDLNTGEIVNIKTVDWLARAFVMLASIPAVCGIMWWIRRHKRRQSVQNQQQPS